jgi:hypothetical protein
MTEMKIHRTNLLRKALLGSARYSCLPELYFGEWNPELLSYLADGTKCAIVGARLLAGYRRRQASKKLKASMRVDGGQEFGRWMKNSYFAHLVELSRARESARWDWGLGIRDWQIGPAQS